MHDADKPFGFIGYAGHPGPMEPTIERLQVCAIGGTPLKRAVTSLVRTAIILLDLGTQEGKPCPDVSVELRADGRVVSIVIDTDHPAFLNSPRRNKPLQVPSA